jgi:TRAP-type C4-dicarboxylate transport system substrate-binding protein
VVKNITVTNGGAIPTAAWVSKAWANKLPADLRKIVLETPATLEDWGSKNAIARWKVAKQQWLDNGAEVIRFSPADQKRYIKAIRKVGVDFLTNHKNAEVRETYARFLKAVAATR